MWGGVGVWPQVVGADGPVQPWKNVGARGLSYREGGDALDATKSLWAARVEQEDPESC